MVAGECEIKCGGEHYREGEYCYYCSDIVTGESYCQDCDGEGNCAVCRSDVDLEHGECVNRQQEAVEALARAIKETGRYGECAGPSVHGCGEGEGGERTCSGSGCGTFEVGVDENERVTKMFVIIMIMQPFNSL